MCDHTKIRHNPYPNPDSNPNLALVLTPSDCFNLLWITSNYYVFLTRSSNAKMGHVAENSLHDIVGSVNNFPARFILLCSDLFVAKSNIIFFGAFNLFLISKFQQ